MNLFGQEKNSWSKQFYWSVNFLPVILFEDFLEVFPILLGWFETGDLFKYLYNLNINIISPAIKIKYTT